MGQAFLFDEVRESDPDLRFPSEPSAEDIERFQHLILSHYEQSARPMPWRETQDPYAILVSEFMLQQTQVARVAEKYRIFLDRWPTLGALARAGRDDVVRIWQGLGYNRRAVFLHRTAVEIDAHHGSQVPDDLDALLALPGIGAYTAGAVLAFAFNRPVLVMDTNIKRVYLHFFFRDEVEVPDSRVSRLIGKSVYSRNPREWYYALMDYGALLGRLYPNANRRSRSYVKQAPFEGSLRQVRGGLVANLSREGGRVVDELCSATGFGADRVREALASLIADGLVEAEGDRYRLRR